MCGQMGIVEDIRALVNSLDEENTTDVNSKERAHIEAHILEQFFPLGIELLRKEAKDEAREELQKQYSIIRQGTATNEVTKIATRKKTKPELTSTGDAKFRHGDFMLNVKNYMQTAGIRTSAHQLLDALCEELTRGGVQDFIVRIPLRKYMNMRGLKDEKSARQQIKEDLQTLSHFRMEFNEKRRKSKSTPYYDLAIIGSNGIENSYIEAAFDPRFIELYKTYNPMPYPQILWKLNNKHHPHSYYFGRKISEHKNLNYGNPNEDIISVVTLIKASPLMPTEEEASGKHYKQLIIEPFEADMDALDEILTWEYCHNKGTPLTDEELTTLYNSGGYHFFTTLLIHVHWQDYPTRPPKTKKRTTTRKKQKTVSTDIIIL